MLYLINKNALQAIDLQGIKNFEADRTGLEPATSAVTGRHSNQLNYRSFRFGLPPPQMDGKDKGEIVYSQDKIELDLAGFWDRFLRYLIRRSFQLA